MKSSGAKLIRRSANGTAPVREFAPDASLDGDAAFRRWRALAVRPTRFGADRVAVTVYIPRGVLSPEEFLKLGGVFAEFGIPAVRLTFEQNILVPALHVSAPAAFYRALKQLGPDCTFESFAGQLDCCIGATICKIGVLDTPKYGAVVGEALDRYFEAHPEKRAKAALLLPELLHFSGCPNSCTAHEVARLQKEDRRRADRLLHAVAQPGLSGFPDRRGRRRSDSRAAAGGAGNPAARRRARAGLTGPVRV